MLTCPVSQLGRSRARRNPVFLPHHSFPPAPPPQWGDPRLPTQGCSCPHLSEELRTDPERAKKTSLASGDARRRKLGTAVTAPPRGPGSLRRPGRREANGEHRAGAQERDSELSGSGVVGVEPGMGKEVGAGEETVNRKCAGNMPLRQVEARAATPRLLHSQASLRC